jgi:hypothetical protein
VRGIAYVNFAQRALCSGKTLAFQANDAGSIPAARSKRVLFHNEYVWSVLAGSSHHSGSAFGMLSMGISVSRMKKDQVVSFA